MAGLARVTICTPRQRVDLTVPEHVPVAELLPDLLRHTGESLADDGEGHGGWVLRRADGQLLGPEAALYTLGIRDGELLHLVPARVHWPEPEYDDVVEAMAAAARDAGPGWDAPATRAAGLVAGGAALAVGLVVLVLSGPPWTVAAAVGLGAAALLTLAGGIASRGYGDPVTGTALGGYALPYAFTGGALLFAGGGGEETQLLVGSAALVLAASAGAVAVGTAPRLFAAGGTAGVCGAAGALVGFWLPAVGAAAVGLAGLVCTVGVLPLLAIRLGRVPRPSLDVVSGRPLRERVVVSAVRRAGSLLAGMLIGYAVAALGAVAILVAAGGTAGRLLALAGSASLLLRARSFVTVAHRVPLLGAGAAGLSVLAVATVPGSAGGATAAVAIALGAVIAGTVYARRSPSPYSSRAADLVDAALVVSVIPLACAVLGLYGRLRNLV